MENQRRKEWLESMLRIVSPVFDALEKEELHKTMPLDFHEERSEYAPLEAFGRSMLGIAPWLEAEGLEEEEEKLQAVWRKKALCCLDAATDPESADFMNFTTGGQPLVDTAFLCHALVRAPKQLAGSLTERVRHNLAQALRSSRGIMAGSTNWLFFSAMVEAGLYLLGEKDYDKMRIAYALRSFEGWYKGDGVYGDGEMFHWDYYNSFVIQPMLEEVSRTAEPLIADKRYRAQFVKSLMRYCELLERMISPDGSYPCMGRSIVYRTGAFHALAHAALSGHLPPSLPPGQVRRALSLALRKMFFSQELFDPSGFLQKGLSGLQPGLAESYINTGSLYLCSTIFLPLGLSPDDAFWTDAEQPTTWEKAWSGANLPGDHAIG